MIPIKYFSQNFILVEKSAWKKKKKAVSKIWELKKMEILSAGAFINLENQEKIEQLKYTAHELANAAIGTDGFVNEEEPARKLALEFWQGLEYMCRENEQATILNIFTGHFLECLRGFRAVNSEMNVVAIDESATIVSDSSQKSTNSEDEFLGVVDEPIIETADLDENQDLIVNIQTQTDDFSAIAENEVAEIAPIETTETLLSESSLEKPEISTVSESAEIESSKTETQVEIKATGGSVCLSEKEPYQFDKCTVTATIQLLPIDNNSEIRKAVLSVKTHDFAPQISMVEILRNNLPLALAPEIEKVLAKYQADLPVKVIDKMKKEKLTAKKSVNKSAPETKTVSAQQPKNKEISSTQNVPTTTAENNSPARPPQAVETGVQGSLFGF